MKSCPVSVCDVPCPADKVMCRVHWLMVPEALQRAVWRAYHRWERDKGDAARVEKLRDVQQQAIEHVNALIDRLPASRTSN